VFGVVNRLTFAEPVDDEVAARFQEAMPMVREAGCRSPLLDGPTDRRTGPVIAAADG
jgi:hypothetical protein